MKIIKMPKFIWNTKTNKTRAKYPYYASINFKKHKNRLNELYEIESLEWLISPEDVTYEYKLGNKIYKLVEVDEEEIKEINLLTNEVINM